MRATPLISLAAVACLVAAAPAGAEPPDPQEPPPTQYDRTPPTIAVTYPDGGHEGWFPDTRSIGIRVTDEGTNGGVSSRVESVTYEMTGATVRSGEFLGGSGTLTVSSEGSTRIDIEAYDGNRNHATSTVWLGVDRTAPTVTFAPPLAQGAEFGLGSYAPARYRCWDEHSGVTDCAGDLVNGTPLNTTTPGTRTFTVRTTDPVGNVRTETISYRVLPGAFSVTTPPTISGTPRTGEVLTATPARFSPDPDQVDHRWYRDGVELSGEEGLTYVVKPVDAGSTIHYASVPRRANYASTPATSSPVSVGQELYVTGQPRVQGSARVGGLLTATGPQVGDWPQVPLVALTPDARIAYHWLRDGRAIPAATAASYRPVAADVGRRLSVRATVTRAGYQPATLTSSATSPVAKATAGLKTTRKSLDAGRVRVVVKVTAPGTVPTGKVTLRHGRKVVGKAKLRKGKARIIVRGLPRGKVRLKVAYAGSAAVARRGGKVVALVR